MIRALAVAILLLAASAAEARWYAHRAIVWTWHPDRAYRVHRLSSVEIDERLCRIEWARNHPVVSWQTLTLAYEGELRCARRHHGAIYE